MPPPTKRRRLPFNPPRPVAAASENASTSTPKSKTSSSRVRKTAASASGPKRGKTQEDLVSRTITPAPMSASPRSRVDPPSTPSEPNHNSPRPDVDSLSSEPEFMLAEITAPEEPEKESLRTSEPDFPLKLLAALVHRNMKVRGEKMRITKDANRLYAKYIDIFAKEAVARAICERKEKLNEDGVARNRTRLILDSYLEVEDLENLTPQLLLDF